jgi:hypothetical protein
LPEAGLSLARIDSKHFSVEEWIHRLDAAILDEVVNAYPSAWDEDHITYAWVARVIRDFRSVRLRNEGQGNDVDWQAFKAKGALERKVGDIAVIVNFHYTARPVLTGVGLLEAKRVSMSGKSYSAIKWSQLARECISSSNHRVLLYDYEHIHLEASLAAQLFCEHLTPDSFHAVHASAVPTVHVIAQNRKDRAISAPGVPLAYQLAVRYLRGFDLDYNHELIEDIRDHKPPRVRYLIVADGDGSNVPSEPGPEPIDPDRFDEIEPYVEDSSSAQLPRSFETLVEELLEEKFKPLGDPNLVVKTAG